MKRKRDTEDNKYNRLYFNKNAQKTQGGTVKDTCIVKGIIKNVIKPEFLSDFRGWAILDLYDPESGDTNTISGRIPFLDIAFEYTFKCCEITKMVKKRRRYNNNNNNNLSKVTEIKIEETVEICRRELDKELIVSLLTLNEICSKRKAQNDLDILREPIKISDLEKFVWYDELHQVTPYFLGKDAPILMSLYGAGSGNFKAYKLLKIGVQKFSQMVDIAKTEPYKLCCPILHDIEDVPAMPIASVNECVEIYEIPPIDKFMLEALTFFQNTLKKIMKQDGHTYFTVAQYNKFPISNKAKKYLLDSGMLIYNEDKGRYYNYNNWEDKNVIVDIMNEMVSNDIRGTIIARDIKFSNAMCDEIRERVVSIERETYNLLLEKSKDPSIEYSAEQCKYYDVNDISLLEDYDTDSGVRIYDHDEDGCKYPVCLPWYKEEHFEFQDEDISYSRLYYRVQEECVEEYEQSGGYMCGKFELNAEQIKAVKLSFTSPLVLISGGPGTGKTSAVIKSIVNRHHPMTYLLVAPTGMAAQRMYETTGVKSYTIDMAIIKLKHHNPKIKDPSKQFEDFRMRNYQGLIIDEGSMVNENLLRRLLPNLPDLAQIIIVGDRNQIQPIGYGCPFAAFIDKYPELTVFLTTNHRVNLNSRTLVSFSKNILEKTPENFEPSTKLGSHPCIFLQREGDCALSRIQEIFSYYPKEKHEQIQVITHRNETCKKVNQWYFNKYHSRNIKNNPMFKPDKKILTKGLCILFTKTNYGKKELDRGIFSSPVNNGEIDFIESIVDVRYKPQKRKKNAELIPTDTKVLVSTLDRRNRCYRRVIYLRSGKRIDLGVVGMNLIEVGNCITGNKSQGNEYQIVVLVIERTSKGILSRNFVRSLAYTIATRPKLQIIVVADFKPTNRCNHFGEFGHIVKYNDDPKRQHDLADYLPSL